jgi:hypothetical protein
MPKDEPHALPIIAGENVWPTNAEREKGLAVIERYAHRWKATPGLLIEKPYVGVVVSLQAIGHDEHYFALTLAVEDAIVAPKDFDAKAPLRLGCVWNQPYKSLSAGGISAPYCFYLYFAPHGVQQLAQFRTTKVFDALKDHPELLLRMLRVCFTRNSDGFADYLAAAAADLEHRQALKIPTKEGEK